MAYKGDMKFNAVLPSLLAAILLIPFVVNFLAHTWFGEKQFVPLAMMKLPVDNAVITLPREVKQYQPFEIGLQLETGELARRINDIVAKSPSGTALQGIQSQVFPEMRAEMAGDAFFIDPPGPQAQIFSSHGETNWSWIVTSEAAGRHRLSLKLYLQTADAGSEPLQIADLADIQVFVQMNLAEWMRTYGIWYITVALLAAGWWWRKRHAKKRTLI